MKQKINHLIDKYISIIKENPTNADEVYKWEAIQHFHKHWNPEADDFGKMFKEVFKKHGNLIHYISYNFFVKLDKYDKDAFKQYILNLYDETVDLETRFIRHKELADKYMAEMNQKTGGNKKHQQDDRTVAFLLAFRYPEKYYLYKSSIHRALCQYLDIKKENAYFKQYQQYAEIGDQFLPYITQNETLQDLAKAFIPSGFPFNSDRLLFQDMAYQTLSKSDQNTNIDSIFNNTGNRKFWVFSPGENASKWEEFYNEGIMALGWDKIGDLRQYEDREAIRKALQEVYNEENNTKTNDSLANDEFLNLIKPGDIVIAKKGMSKLIGYGIVTSDYKYDENRSHYQKIREVNWIKKGEWTTSNVLPMKTLTEITEENAKRYIAIIEGVNLDETQNKIHSNEKWPLNQILYGPPGTGKTYETKKLAVSIIDGNVSDDRTLMNTRYNALLENRQIAFVTFHQSMNYEDFVEGIKPIITDKDDVAYKVQDGIFKSIAQEAKHNAGKNYVLIIDEINRANVSAVFGELISLIEPDKRIGNKEALKATLPYSKNTFGVPANLYIIATMNTADRSVEALDTALRRRFVFTELMPDEQIFEKINDVDEIFDGIKKSEILKTINNRIELLLDRDHRIGHSYFINVMNADELVSAFNDRILPLLQEYFFGDYAKIGLILGKSFVEPIDTQKIQFADFDLDTSIYEPRKLYQLLPLTRENIKEAMKNLLAN